jgi:hypothetical protein
MDIKELKAQAYDTLAQIETWQGKLRQLNQMIAQESAKPKKEEKKEEEAK